MVAYDCGDQRLARELNREAELLAASTNIGELLVHIYSNMTMQSMYMARMSDRVANAREGLRLANRAAAAAKHEPSPQLHALVALRQAMAHSAIGPESAFRGAVKQARHELDRGSHPADPSWTRFVVEDEITGHEAMGHVRLDAPPKPYGSIRAFSTAAGSPLATARTISHGWPVRSWQQGTDHKPSAKASSCCPSSNQVN